MARGEGEAVGSGDNAGLRGEEGWIKALGLFHEGVEFAGFGKRGFGQSAGSG